MFGAYLYCVCPDMKNVRSVTLWCVFDAIHAAVDGCCYFPRSIKSLAQGSVLATLTRPRFPACAGVRGCGRELFLPTVLLPMCACLRGVSVRQVSGAVVSLGTLCPLPILHSCSK